MRIRDPGWRQFGSGMEKSRIRDKHPGSATLQYRQSITRNKWSSYRGILYRQGTGTLTTFYASNTNTIIDNNFNENLFFFYHAGGYFFMRAKTHNRRFRGVFRGGQDFFDPQIVLSAAKGNFGVKGRFRNWNIQKSPPNFRKTIWGPKGDLEHSKKPRKFPNHSQE
jgi:hypothetical protein